MITEGFINCFTDGSVKKNGDLNTIGGFACYFPEHQEYNIKTAMYPKNKYSESINTNTDINKIQVNYTTNNIAEYSAAICAIKKINEINLLNGSDHGIIIYSDSLLLVKTVNEWMHKWAKNNWTRSSGEIKNLELVKELYELVNSKTRFVWVKAHSKNNDYFSINNNIVDVMSRCY